ncbi:hypothetical protein [Streptomyces sp. NPDC048172]|uniref:hypothetical protein n=1 Tax=Streptomyces sp. NPDC048172 TaxID=3365505 RepID=UPI0037187CBC
MVHRTGPHGPPRSLSPGQGLALGLSIVVAAFGLWFWLDPDPSASKCRMAGPVVLSCDEEPKRTGPDPDDDEPLGGIGEDVEIGEGTTDGGLTTGGATGGTAGGLTGGATGGSLP